MGTYTANKNLYMPSVGETGWGTLMNTNISTIDNFLKPITVSGSTYTFTGNQTGGTITATKITNSGTLTQTGTSTFTGKITANGGIGTKALTATTGTFSGAVTGASGTFEGMVIAKNLNRYGMIPYTLYLLSTNPGDRIFNYTKPFESQTINSNSYTQFTLFRSDIYISSGSTTYKIFNGLNDDFPAVLTDIVHVSGSWKFTISTQSASVTATIKGFSGTITNTPRTITNEQAVSLLCDIQELTLNNSTTSAIRSGIYITLTNTGSSAQYYTIALEGLYE